MFCVTLTWLAEKFVKFSAAGCLRIMFQQQLSKLIGHATTQILQNQFKFAVSQLPKVAKWGLPAAVGGIRSAKRFKIYY
jgi:hypothetical protein